jgi:hypothetical protein
MAPPQWSASWFPPQTSDEFLIMPVSVIVILWFIAVLPPVRSTLEATMSSHMLIHIPALILIGWKLASMIVRKWPKMLPALRPYRWALLVVAGCTFVVWMIPRLLDLAAENPLVDVVKAITLTLAGGLPLQMAWRNLGPVMRGVLHVEVLASLLRLGWIYLESPVRLCTSYGLFDQYRLGKLLLEIGACYAVWLAWHVLHGSPAAGRFKQKLTHVHSDD